MQLCIHHTEQNNWLRYQRNTSSLTKAVCRPVPSWDRKSYDLQISLTPTIRDNIVYNSVAELQNPR